MYKLSQDFTHQKSLKSVNFWQSYLKNKKVDVFFRTQCILSYYLTDKYVTISCTAFCAVSVQITMPSGTTVTAKYDCYKPSSATDKDCYLEITVFPLAEDYDNAEGLCGNFDGDKDNDRTPKGSTVSENEREPVTFIRSYMSVTRLCYVGSPVWGRGTPLSPLVHLLPRLFLLFLFFHWLCLFSSFVHPFPFYQNSPTPFPGQSS